MTGHKKKYFQERQEQDNFDGIATLGFMKCFIQIIQTIL